MKPTLPATVFSIAVLGIAILVGIQPFKSRPASQKEVKHVPSAERLRWFAQQAKNEGMQTVTIPSLQIEYSGDSTAITLEEAVKVSTVVIAQLVEKKSYEQNGNNIVTWNKFRIKEVLAEASEKLCPHCPSEKPPQEMLPLQSQEFLLSKAGGRLSIDGIEIEQIEAGFPEFQENARYLLFITLHPTGVAATMGGPVGVFRLNDKGNALPVSESSHLLKKEFKDKLGNSPDRLRSLLHR